MPYHVEQDGLEEARLSKTGAQFGSTKRGIAYAYGDKYMKKTLRMGDLLHLDDAVKKRLVTMVDSKNLVMEGSYNAAPISVDEMWAWLEKYAAIFAITSAMWASIWPTQMPPARRCCSRPSWALCATSTSASTPTPPLPTSSALTPPIGAGIPGHKLTQLHRRDEGLLLLRGRRPLCHRAGHDRGKSTRCVRLATSTVQPPAVPAAWPHRPGGKPLRRLLPGLR